MKTGIYVIATPIGNLNDISARAIEVLKEAEVVACEDTRVTKKLFSLLGISLKKTFIILGDHNESEMSNKVIAYAKSGAVALVSDAGSPLISDPGFKLIKKCKEENIYVTVIPGCCALICALQLSGLPTNSFMFAGFVPNKEKARGDLFTSLKAINTTLVFYETAQRIKKTLEKAKEVFGNRELSVAREITKMFEECVNGTASELLAHFEAKEPKGEMVFMVSPPLDEENDIDIEAVLKVELETNTLKMAVKNVVEKYNVHKNEVYEIALRLKDEQL